MTRRSQAPMLTRDEQRIADNVRPRGELDPTQCQMQHGRGLRDRTNNCAACGVPFAAGSQMHCNLLEQCDRCTSEDDPCGNALVMRSLPRGAHDPQGIIQVARDVEVLVRMRAQIDRVLAERAARDKGALP